MLAIAACLLLVLILLGGSGGGGMTAEEDRIAKVLSSIAGAGKVEVALFYQKDTSGLSGGENGAPTGAVIVAQGAEDMQVRLTLIRAARTLLSLDENSVEVFRMEAEQ